MREVAVAVDGVRFDYGTSSRFGKTPPVRALRGVTFEVPAGSCFGLVGESGSGKSTLIRLMNGLLRGYSGSVRVFGREVDRLDRRGLRRYQSAVQMVFQDTYSSLNPRDTVAELISEGWLIHPHLIEGRDQRVAVQELMATVGLHEDLADAYPHQLSGGQRQRVAIARALALEPKILLCDEPTSALDVSIQAQIIKLLDDLRCERGLTLIVVSHDLGVIRSMADRVGILYLGTLVELGTCDEVFHAPEHPYTNALLSSAFTADAADQEEIILEGEIPSPTSSPSGCVFRTRCWKGDDRCAEEVPGLEPRPGDRSSASVACHYPIGDEATL